MTITGKLKEGAGYVEEEAGEKLAKTETFRETGEKMKKDGRETREEGRREDKKAPIPTAPGQGYKGN